MMPGPEGVLFKHGLAHNAFKFKDKNMARYADIHNKHSAAASTKSTEEITSPEFMVPTIEEVETNINTNMKIWEREYDKYNRDKNV